jgi:hypothetical protein
MNGAVAWLSFLLGFANYRRNNFGLRRQSAAATALSGGVECSVVQSAFQSGVALRLPPQSKNVFAEFVSGSPIVNPQQLIRSSFTGRARSRIPIERTWGSWAWLAATLTPASNPPGEIV